MKKIVLSALFVGSTFLALAQPAPPKPATANIDRGYKVKVGDQAPDDYQLVLSDGRKTSLKQLRGKVVVLQFTASWCGVCRQEMPHLQKDVWEANKDKGLILIGVDRDEPLDKVKKFQQDMKITYPLALDPGADIFGRYADKKSGVYNPAEFKAMVKVIDALVNKAGV
jgi:peroxiredoxin